MAPLVALSVALAPIAAIGATLASTPASAAPAAYLSLAKSASVTNYSIAGTSITYSYLVTNVGPITLSNVVVTDPMPGLSPINCGSNSNVISSLAPAASVTCTATYTVTLADLNAGSLTNTGTASADTPVGDFTVQSTLTIPAVQNGQFNIVKTANVQSFSAVGQVITYSFTVTNTGNVTITGILVTDSLPGLSVINCGGNSPVIPSLAPGASVTCTATYTVTAADLKRKSITNTAFAEGIGPNDGKITSSSDVVVPEAGQPIACTNPEDYLSQTNSLTGVPPTVPTQLYGTTSNVWTYAHVGTPHAPTYNALGWDTFNGYLYATQVTPAPTELLRIDASGTATVVGPITPSSGSFNFATQNGPDVGAFDAAGDYWFMESGTTVAWEIPANEILANLPLVAHPFNLVNAAGAPTPFGAADWTLAGGSNTYLWGLHSGIIYRIALAATGPLLVTSYPAPVQLGSDSAGAAWQFSNGNLGFSNNLSGTIFQVQVNTPATPTFTYKSMFPGPIAGRINDGTSCLGAPTDLGITKTGPATVTLGGTVTWALTITNYGPGNSSGYVVNDTIPAGVTGVTTSDPNCTIIGNAIQCIEGTLNVGNSYTILVTGTDTAPTGSCFTNSASVLANEQDTNQENNTASYTTCVTSGISLVKSASVTSVSAAGTVITYSYAVTNTGPTTIYNVTVTDPMPGLSAINCGGNSPVIPALAPSQTVICTATYTTTTANIDAGSIKNIGTATGQTATGPVSATSSVTIPAEQIPGVSIQKESPDDSYSTVGQVIPYDFVVTNTGNVTLTNVTVTDPMPGLSAINCGGNSPIIPSLAPGASVTCTATYTVTAANVKNKSITNVARVTGDTPTDSTVTAQSSLTIPEEGSPIVCAQEVDYLSQSNSSAGPPTVPTQLYETFPNIWTYITDGAPVTPTYNALGYDPKNDYLYAVRVHPSSQDLLQIDSTGAVVGTETIGAPYVNPGGGPDVGAFDAAGNYWFMTSNAPDAWEIPVAQITSHAAVLTPVKVVLKGTFAPADWSEVNGALWGVSGTKIYKFAGGVVTTYAAPPALAAIGAVDKTFGAAWTFSNGDLGVSNNLTGWIFEIHITAAGPTFAVVFQKKGPVAGSINDGAACSAINDADLGIVKTGPATVAQNGTVTWTLAVTNHGPGISSGYVVNDAVPVQYTNVASTTPGCTVVGNHVQCIEGTLYVGQTATITITAKASAKPDVCVANSASVIGNEADPNQKNNTSSVTTCTTSGIVVVKTTDITSYAGQGEVIGYTFVVTNTNAVTAKDPAQTTEDTLTDVKVVDALKGLSQVDCGHDGDLIASIRPGASATCRATFTTTAASVKAGDVRNIAIATGYNGVGDLQTSAQASVTTPRGVHVTTTSLSDASVGTAYKVKLVAVGGGGHTSWVVSEGSLPRGLKLSSAGVLSGKPTTDGTYAFTVTVRTTKTSKVPAESATQTLTLLVKPIVK